MSRDLCSSAPQFMDPLANPEPKLFSRIEPTTSFLHPATEANHTLGHVLHTSVLKKRPRALLSGREFPTLMQ